MPPSSVGLGADMGFVDLRTNQPVRRRATVARSAQGTVHLNVLSRCRKVYQPARSFKELVALVRAAEERMLAQGMDDWEDRVAALRGLYYGTEWSTDFEKEKSTTRNLGFRKYTASPADPDDVRPMLECGIARSLQRSQDVKDGKNLLDFGHFVIGLDARRKRLARSWNFSEGGTGLEICTWLGDLGGGAAMLAKDRIDHPGTPVHKRMSGSDFGGAINLEGDVAAYVAASALGEQSIGPPVLPNERIADALSQYLDLKGDHWRRRASIFLVRNGAQLQGAAVANRAEVVGRWAEKIEDFGALYLLIRLKDQGKLDTQVVRRASIELPPAAVEVATVFFEALVLSHVEGGSPLAPQRVVAPPRPVLGRANGLLDRAASAAEAASDLGDFLKGFFE